MQKSLWIGRLDSKTLVYDSSIQLPDCPHVFLWDSTSGEMQKYIPTVVRTLIRKNSDPEASAIATAAYDAWKLNESPSWIAEESKYYEQRSAKEAGKNPLTAMTRETMVQRHRDALEAAGKAYLGVRDARSPRNRRITHCYSCKQSLDNSIDVECVACNWILCLCGACGCGYQRET
jgi:hypothetical protein